MIKESVFETARKLFHATLAKEVLKIDKNGVPSNADKDSKLSVAIAQAIADRIGISDQGERLAGQRSGNKFEEICKDFLINTFGTLSHMRPGNWEISKTTGSREVAITKFDQYKHLASLSELAKANPELAATLGGDYMIKPDVVVFRHPEEDSQINSLENLVDDKVAKLTSLRKTNNSNLILHASVSCKWTLRSDRAQNARSEGLNLVRNRKGRLPHIVVVTGEPTPNRIASIALGTGDIDCVYHFALPELVASVTDLKYHDAAEMLQTMIEGKRLKDIADLPLDLAI